MKQESGCEQANHFLIILRVACSPLFSGGSQWRRSMVDISRMLLNCEIIYVLELLLNAFDFEF